MNNDLINELNNKIDAQDKIINEQVLEIANLKEDKETLVLTIKTILKEKEELEQKIDKAIEKLKEIKTDLDFEPWSIYQVKGEILFDFLEILGDKEQPKVIVNEDMAIKLDELKNQFNDVWEYGDR